MGTLNRALVVASIGLLTLGCGSKEKGPLPNSFRIQKSILKGNFLYLKTVTNVESPGPENGVYPKGLYLEADKVIRFAINETALEIESLSPSLKRETVLASFPIKHIDLVTKDGKKEENSSDRVWNLREYFVLDVTSDALDSFKAETVTSQTAKAFEWDSKLGAINFAVSRRLKDDTNITVRTSFLRDQNRTYAIKEYSDTLQTRFGYFKTKVAEPKGQELVNRFDPKKPVTFYLSPGFPSHLVPEAERIFATWNKALSASTGNPNFLRLETNSGQELGDLRYSMVFYDLDPTQHSILGYGPSANHPFTGETVKADVILFGGVLKKSGLGSQVWESLLNEEKKTAHENLQEIDLSGDLGAMLKPFSLEETIRSVRKIHDGKTCFQQLNDETVREILEVKFAQKAAPLSNEETETRFLGATLGHELGHTLGLRHNFQASADEKHFAKGAHASSWMDYGFLIADEPTEVGSYDQAAVDVLYGESKEREQTALNENYFYCTDSGLMDSRNPLCSPYDRATDLVSLIKNTLSRYEASYAINNNRVEGLPFPSLNGYLGRVSTYLGTLRLAFDNATAIQKAAEEKSPAKAIWYVAGQRIEADSDSKKENIIEISAQEGVSLFLENGELKKKTKLVVKKVDKEKMEKAIADANAAVKASYGVLRAILTDKERPLHNETDDIKGVTQVRGVLYDKLLTIMYLGTRTTSPSINGGSVSMFKEVGDNLTQTFVNIVSNTWPNENGVPDLQKQDINVRRTALSVLKQLSNSYDTAYVDQALKSRKVTIDHHAFERKLELKASLASLEMQVRGASALAAAEIGTISANPLLGIIPARIELSTIETFAKAIINAKTELAALEKGTSEEMRSMEAVETFRAARRALVNTLVQTTDAKERTKLRADVIKIEKARNEINRAYLNVFEDDYLRAPISISYHGFQNAVGLMIRDNLNRVEDRRMAYQELLDELRDEITEAAEKELPNLVSIEAKLSAAVAADTVYLDAEKKFLGSMLAN